MDETLNGPGGVPVREMRIEYHRDGTVIVRAVMAEKAINLFMIEYAKQIVMDYKPGPDESGPIGNSIPLMPIREN